jgi:hypothetical protein
VDPWDWSCCCEGAVLPPCCCVVLFGFLAIFPAHSGSASKSPPRLERGKGPRQDARMTILRRATGDVRHLQQVQRLASEETRAQSRDKPMWVAENLVGTALRTRDSAFARYVDRSGAGALWRWRGFKPPPARARVAAQCGGIHDRPDPGVRRP